MDADLVHIQMLLTGAQKAVAEARAVSGAVKGVGTASTAAGAASATAAPKHARAAKVITGLAAAARTASLVMGGAMVFGAYKATQAAVNLGEQENKTRVVFGKASGQMLRWGKTTADSFGLSNRAALEFSGTFGNMLVPMGFARKKAADMSRGLVELSSDMASFNNAEPTEVLEALRAGLAGETEPLRRFGVFLSDDRLALEAMHAGLGDNTQALTEQQKAQLRYNIIQRDTTDAHGDFARTSESLANKQRILKAQIEDLGAKIGTALIPPVSKAVGWILDFVDALEKGRVWAIALTVGVLAIVGGLGVFSTAVSIAGALGITMGIGVAAAWFLIPAAIIAVGIGFLILYHKVEAFRNAVDATWRFIKKFWPLLLIPLAMPIRAILFAIVHFRTLKSVAMGVFNWIRTAAGAVGGAVKAAFSSVASAVSSAFISVINACIDALNWLIGAFNDVFDRSIDPPGPGPSFEGIHIDEISHIGKSWQGGLVRSAGARIVGDRGPELLDFPVGARITPLTSAGPVYSEPLGSGWAGPAKLVSVLKVDGRTLAEVEQDVRDDEDART